MSHELQEQVRELVKGKFEEDRAREQEEALRRLQGAVDKALVAALEANDGKPLTKREAINIVSDIIIDTHCNVGMTVTANVDIDENGMATAEVTVVGKRDPRQLEGANEWLQQQTMDVFRGLSPPLFSNDDLPPPPPPPSLPPMSYVREAFKKVSQLKSEPEPEEQVTTTEKEFVALKERDNGGKVVHVSFRPNPEEKQDDGEDGADRGRDRRNERDGGREAQAVHDADTGEADRGVSAEDETRHPDPTS
jgi:hypothetical protein